MNEEDLHPQGKYLLSDLRRVGYDTFDLKLMKGERVFSTRDINEIKAGMEPITSILAAYDIAIAEAQLRRIVLDG